MISLPKWLSTTISHFNTLGFSFKLFHFPFIICIDKSVIVIDCMPACLLFDFSSHWWQKKQSERMGDTARVPWSTWRLRGNEPLPHMPWWQHWPFIPCPPFSVHPSQAERKKNFNKRWKLICSEWTGTGRRRNRSWEKESCVDLGFFFTFSILFK